MLLLVKTLFGLIVSYLIGSIPTAYLFGRLFKGIDIREHGSGNVGATNAMRVLGKGPGIAVLILDACKGIVATTIVANLLDLTQILILMALGLAAVVGHNWTIFLRFKGGKGVTTTLGVLIGLMINIEALRLVVVLSVLVWIVVFLISGFVSLSSIVAAITLPIFIVVFNQSADDVLSLITLGIILCLFVVLRHRPNIKRLLAKQEPRVNFSFKKQRSS